MSPLYSERDLRFAMVRVVTLPSLEQVIERIAQELPGKDWVQWSLSVAREIAVDRNWRPLTPEEVIALVPASRNHSMTLGTQTPDKPISPNESAQANEIYSTSRQTGYHRLTATTGPEPMTRNELLDTLSHKINATELNQLATKLGISDAVLPGKNAPHGDHAIAVLKWSEARNRTAELEHLCRNLLGANALPR